MRDEMGGVLDHASVSSEMLDAVCMAFDQNNYNPPQVLRMPRLAVEWGHNSNRTKGESGGLDTYFRGIDFKACRAH